jgi:hypothetical protein
MRIFAASAALFAGHQEKALCSNQLEAWALQAWLEARLHFKRGCINYHCKGNKSLTAGQSLQHQPVVLLQSTMSARRRPPGHVLRI